VTKSGRNRVKTLTWKMFIGQVCKNKPKSSVFVSI
jgi:hypothetical protein